MAAGGSFEKGKPKARNEVAGVQQVIKFFNNEPIDVTFIEHTSMALACMTGITVDETQVGPLAGEHALAVHRYEERSVMRIYCVSAGYGQRAETVEGQEPGLGYPVLSQRRRRTGLAERSRNLSYQGTLT